MKKEILTPEELGLFRNCKVEYFDYFKNEYLIGTLQGIAGDNHFFIREDNSGQEICKCRPILRPITDITDAELEEYFMIDRAFEGITISHVEFFNREKCLGRYAVRFNCKYVIDKTGKKKVMIGTITFRRSTPKQFQYLLSKQFDIFEWIKDDLAIQGELRNVPEPIAPVPCKNLFPPIS